MKKAYLKELQGMLLGSMTDNDDALDYFSTDSSIFQITPEAVIYPENTADVRKAVQFLADRAKAGKPASLIPRGKGTDQTGGSIGEGLQLVLPAHMNRILRLEKDYVVVQPGILYRTLQQALHTHGRFLPPYPASIDYSSIGGAVANNAAGEKTVKYGTTRQFVKRLKVVLADGSLIETYRISARELNRKKGLATFEGEVYRKLDSLILDNADIIRKHQLHVTKNASGYALGEVKHADGSFDLSQIMVGSQGTLGVVTEATLKTLPWNPRSSLVVGYFDDIHKAGEAIGRLRALSPSAIELVDIHLLAYVREHRPQDIEGLVPEQLPKLVLLVEFDDFSQLAQTVKSRRAQKIFARTARSSRTSTDPVEQEALWKLRRSAAATVWMSPGAKKALPFIEDGVVPVAKLPQFLDKLYKLLDKYELEIAVWGHAGDANLHLQPFLDLAKKKDVEKLYELNKEFTDLVVSLGGSISGEHNDGLLRGPYLEQQFGKEMYQLFVDVKHIFDPQNILNPNTKVEVTEEYARQFLRDRYVLGHLADHLPHT